MPVLLMPRRTSGRPASGSDVVKIGVVDIQRTHRETVDGAEIVHMQTVEVQGEGAVGLEVNAAAVPPGLGDDFFEAGVQGGLGRGRAFAHALGQGIRFDLTSLGEQGVDELDDQWLRQIVLAAIVREQVLAEIEILLRDGVAGVEGEDFAIGGDGVAKVQRDLEVVGPLEQELGIPGIEVGGVADLLQRLVELAFLDQRMGLRGESRSGAAQVVQCRLGAVAGTDDIEGEDRGDGGDDDERGGDGCGSRAMALDEESELFPRAGILRARRETFW